MSFQDTAAKFSAGILTGIFLTSLTVQINPDTFQVAPVDTACEVPDGKSTRIDEYLKSISGKGNLKVFAVEQSVSEPVSTVTTSVDDNEIIIKVTYSSDEVASGKTVSNDYKLTTVMTIIANIAGYDTCDKNRLMYDYDLNEDNEVTINIKFRGE